VRAMLLLHGGPANSSVNSPLPSFPTAPLPAHVKLF